MTEKKEKIPIEKQIKILETLLSKIDSVKGLEDKLKILNELPDVQYFNKYFNKTHIIFDSLTSEFEFVVKSIAAIGQAPIIFRLNEADNQLERLHILLHQLLDVEKFYMPIGGIIGYHLTMLKLIFQKDYDAQSQLNKHYLRPEGVDIRTEASKVHSLVRKGIEFLGELCEIYPVGGAGDRLNLTRELTGEPLPVALLNFQGKTLLEGLFRDLQAREFLHYKLCGIQLNTPVALMTSKEKNNYEEILTLCEENNWFGRSKNQYLFFIQPLAPVLTKEGDWSLSAPLSLTLKPGGHGVIWKLALEQGVLKWLEAQGRKKIILRQINNPIAGLDLGLLALSGLGSSQNKAFGFASCERYVKASEGSIVLVEQKNEKSYDYWISNIEYVEFEKKGIQDTPVNSEKLVSQFPSNTNILFADLSEIKEAVTSCPFPGMLINMKLDVPFIDADGHRFHEKGGRLETMMQNISDQFVESFPRQLEASEHLKLKTFITYNHRNKTISTTKNSYVKGNSLNETPEGALNDLLQNYYDLFVNYCHMKLGQQFNLAEYLEASLPYYILLHPALGPLYSIIAQKIKGGSLADCSELQLEISELEMQNVDITGSLVIKADSPLGSKDEKDTINYSSQMGKCILRDVVINNKGIVNSTIKDYLRNSLKHEECFKINLMGNAEFFAEGVTFIGDYQINVPAGYRMIAVNKKNDVELILEKISHPTWNWMYTFDDEDQIVLTQNFHK